MTGRRRKRAGTGSAGDGDGHLRAEWAERRRGEGSTSIIGGHVYRGDALPFLTADYVFADIMSGGRTHLATTNFSQEAQRLIYEFAPTT